MSLIRSLQADSLAVSLDGEGLIPLGLTVAPEQKKTKKNLAKDARGNVKLHTRICQTLWACAEWELQHAKLMWRKVGQTMNSKRQQSGCILMQSNYTNIKY